MILTKPQPFIKPNLWDNVLLQGGVIEDAGDTRYIPVQQLPQPLLTAEDYVDAATLQYENITKENKGRKAGAYKSPSNKAGELGTVSNPIIEKRVDPDTGVESDHRIVFRGDDQVIAYSPNEWTEIEKQYTDKNIQPNTVAKLPVGMDILDPANQNSKPRNNIPVTASQNPSTASNNARYEIINNLSKTTNNGSTSGTFVDPVATQAAYDAYKKREDEKIAAWQAQKAKIQQDNALVDYYNAVAAGEVPGTPQYTADLGEFHGRYNQGVHRGRSGERVSPAGQAPEPVAPLPDLPPDPSTFQASISERQYRPPAQRDPNKPKNMLLVIGDDGKMYEYSTINNINSGHTLAGQYQNAMRYPTQMKALIEQQKTSTFQRSDNGYSKPMKYNYYNPQTKKVESRVVKFDDAMQTFIDQMGSAYADKNNPILKEVKHPKGYTLNFEYIFETYKDPTSGKLKIKIDPNTGQKVVRTAAVKALNELVSAAARATVYGYNEGFNRYPGVINYDEVVQRIRSMILPKHQEQYDNDLVDLYTHNLGLQWLNNKYEQLGK